MRAIVCLAVLVALAACADQHTIHQSNIANVASADDGKCRSMGAAPGSDRYFQCRMALERDRSQAAAAGEALARQGSYSTMMGIGYGMTR